MNEITVTRTNYIARDITSTVYTLIILSVSVGKMEKFATRINPVKSFCYKYAHYKQSCAARKKKMNNNNNKQCVNKRIAALPLSPQNRFSGKIFFEGK